jgi:hypothetical protein
MERSDAKRDRMRRNAFPVKGRSVTARVSRFVALSTSTVDVDEAPLVVVWEN